ncbi:MAG TPA: hypothetical protein VI653_25160 [Steroidobacteraceae bacterium]
MRSTSVAMCCALVTLTLPLAAQDHQAARRVGIGITVPDVGVLLPINIGRHLRLEPFVDFFAARADFPVTADTSWESSTQIGLGLFSVAAPQEQLAVYFGPRIGYLHGSTKVSGSGGQTSTTSKGWFVAAALGGEYRLVSRFSLGAEAKVQFNHTSSSSSGSLNIGPSLFARSVFSSGALVVRFYM